MKVASGARVFGWLPSWGLIRKSARLSAACVTDLALGSHAIGAIDPDVLSNDTLGRLLKAQVLFELW